MAFTPGTFGNKENVHPPLTCILQKQKCLAELEAKFNGLSLHITPETQASNDPLVNYLQGKPVDEHLSYIDSMLSGLEQDNFDTMLPKAIQRTILLLLCRYSSSKQPEDLKLLLRITPYYINYLSIQPSFVIEGIFASDLAQSKQISHDLDELASNFAKGERLQHHSMANELSNMLKVLSSFCDLQPNTSHVSMACGLLDWKQQTHITLEEFANVFKACQEICSTKPDATALYEKFCSIHQDSSYNNALFRFVVGYDLLLQQHTIGQDCSKQIDYIESVLTNKEALGFQTFEPRQQQAIILLLLSSWKNTDKEEYLHLVLCALPYCIKHIDSLCTADYQLDTMVAQFLQNSACVNNNADFVSFLSRIVQFRDINFLATTLDRWYEADKLTPKKIAEAVHICSKILLPTSATAKDYEKTTCKLVKLFLKKTEESEFCLDILFGLFCTNKENNTPLEWCLTLEKGKVFSLVVDLLNHKDFPRTKKTWVINKCLLLNAEERVLKLALHLIPSMPLSQLKLFFSRINTAPLPVSIDEVMALVIHLPQETQKELRLHVANCFKVLGALEKAARKTPNFDGTEFLLEIARKNLISDKPKQQLYKIWLRPNASIHTIALAGQIITPYTVNEIEAVYTKLIHDEQVFTEAEAELRDAIFERLAYLTEHQPDSKVLSDFVAFMRNGPVKANSHSAWNLKYLLEQRIFRPEESAHILDISARITQFICENPQSELTLHMITLMRNGIICAEITDKVLGALVDKNDPELLVLATKIPYALPLSAVKHLLEKIEVHPNATSGLALHELFENVHWYNDLARHQPQDPSWCPKRNIYLYTSTDTHAVDLAEKLDNLSLACGIKTFATPAAICSKIEEVISRKKDNKAKQGKKPLTLLQKATTLNQLEQNKLAKQKAAQKELEALQLAAATVDAAEEYERPNSPEPADE